MLIMFSRSPVPKRLNKFKHRVSLPVEVARSVVASLLGSGYILVIPFYKKTMLTGYALQTVYEGRIISNIVATAVK